MAFNERVEFGPARHVWFIDKCKNMPDAARKGIIEESIIALRKLPQAQCLRTIIIVLKELTDCKYHPSSLQDFVDCIDKIGATKSLARATVLIEELEQGINRINIHVDVIVADRIRYLSSLSKTIQYLLKHELTHILTYGVNKSERLRAGIVNKLNQSLCNYEKSLKNLIKAPDELARQANLRVELSDFLTLLFLEGVAMFMTRISSIRWNEKYLHKAAKNAQMAALRLKDAFGKRLEAIRKGEPLPKKNLSQYTYDMGFYMVYALLYLRRDILFWELMAWPVFKFLREAERACWEVTDKFPPPFSLGYAHARKGPYYERGAGIFDYNEAIARWIEAVQQRQSPLGRN